MKVIQVLLHDGIGGMETLARSLEALLPDYGWTVRTLFLDRNLHLGAKTGRLTRLRRLHAEIARESGSVVLSHSALPNIYSRMAAPRSLPVVTVLHGSTDWEDLQIRSMERALNRFATAAVVAVSPAQAWDYRRIFPNPQVPLHVVPNGVTLPKVGARSAPLASEPTLLTVGRLVPSKHVHTLLQACSYLLSDGQSFRLMVVGDGPDQEYVRSLHRMAQADPGLAGRVRWLGAQADIDSFMCEADLLVHPSESEVHSLTLMEAAVRGLPVVISDSVASGLTGEGIVARVFASGSASSLAATLRLALNELGDLHTQGLARLPAMREKYSIENAAARYGELLAGVAAAVR